LEVPTASFGRSFPTSCSFTRNVATDFVASITNDTAPPAGAGAAPLAGVGMTVLDAGVGLTIVGADMAAAGELAGFVGADDEYEVGVASPPQAVIVATGNAAISPEMLN
jgi:hypothetical protein